MIEETVDIKTADGQMETFLCYPERGGPYPAVYSGRRATIEIGAAISF